MLFFKKKKVLGLFITIILLAAIGIFCYWQNNDIMTTNILFSNKKIPLSFNSFKILQVSDLHNKSFGKNQDKLIERCKDTKPDIIAITGDLIDSSNTNLENALTFVDKAIKIAPVYFVSGNHEHWSGKYIELVKKLEDLGVIILDNKATVITKDEQQIKLMGLTDPASDQTESMEYDLGSKQQSVLAELINGETEKFTILLSHRSELMSIYAKVNIDLALCGHAHGGQVRIPFIGGVIAPDQGWFPKYTSGKYKEENTTMIVSRGLGNSVVPQRIFNRPELVVVTLGRNDFF